MREIDGRETLAQIKADRYLRSIPVVVFTTSDYDMDIFSAYDNYANSYVVKPKDITGFIEVVQSIADYWFITVKHFLR